MADSIKKVPSEAFLAKNGYKYDVFLCHAGENKDLVSKLYWKLCSYDILPFFDELSLKMGDDGHEVMMEAVERTSRFVAPLITHEVKGKPWPQIEMEKALERHKRDKLVVLPVFLLDPDKTSESTVPILREISKISGTKLTGEDHDDLVLRASEAIVERVKDDNRPCPPPKTKQTVDHKQEAPFIANERLDEDDQLGPAQKKSKRESDSDDKDGLSDMAYRLKNLNANDLGLADKVEVSVISVSNYICNIQCTHEEALKLEDTSPLNSYILEIEGTRNLLEVNHISKLPMVSKIVSLEVTADIDMPGPSHYQIDDDDNVSPTPETKSSATLNLETYHGQKINKDQVLASEVLDEYDEGRALFHVEERLCLRADVDDIHKASLHASADDVSSATLKNIRTITTVSVTQ